MIKSYETLFPIFSIIQPWTENLPSVFSMIHVVVRWSKIIIDIVIAIIKLFSLHDIFFDDQQHFLQITTTTHIMIFRWSKMWSIFQIITVGIRGSSRVCDEQRELSWNSGFFPQKSSIFLKIFSGFGWNFLKIEFLLL